MTSHVARQGAKKEDKIKERHVGDKKTKHKIELFKKKGRKTVCM